MGRASSISRIDWAVGVNPTSNSGVVTGPQMILGAASYSITVRQTPGNAGTISGSFKLQITDFGQSDQASAGLQPLSADWVDVNGSSQVWSSGPLNWSVTLPAGKFVRVVFTDVASSGATVDVAFSATQFEA